MLGSLQEAIEVLRNKTSDENAKTGALQALQILLEPIDNANGETLCNTHDSKQEPVVLSDTAHIRATTGTSGRQTAPV